jgi:hypothetical protein
VCSFGLSCDREYWIDKQTERQTHTAYTHTERRRKNDTDIRKSECHLERKVEKENDIGRIMETENSSREWERGEKEVRQKEDGTNRQTEIT